MTTSSLSRTRKRDDVFLRGSDGSGGSGLRGISLTSSRYTRHEASELGVPHTTASICSWGTSGGTDAFIVKLTLPLATLGATTASVAEGASAINLTVTLSAAPTYTTTVGYSTSNGTATAGSDYSATSGTLTFAPGITSQAISVPIIDDDSDEPNETFALTLNSPSNAILGTPSSTTVTITDDDSAPTVSWQAGNFNAGEASGSGLVTVLLSAASSFTVTVQYATSDGSATLTPPPPDYTAKSGTLTFAPGVTSQSVGITILNDTPPVAESNETVNLTLSAPTNATITGINPATLTILDDDGGAQPSEEFYTYDQIGNMLSKTGVGAYTNGANGDGTGAGPHRIKQINGGAAFVYDPNGNLTSGGGGTYTWDYENRPLTISTTSGSESYAYDADGERVKVVAGSTTTVYLAGLWEETGAGATKAYYTFGGQIVAMRNSAEPADPVSYLHGDHLGSVSVASGAGASNKGSQRFDPWGKAIAGGITNTRKNYTGQYLDTTGLLYYHARYYDPTLARFVSADSVVPGSADGVGGNAATLGMDEAAQLKPLTVDFHDPGFVATLNGENRIRFWFQLNDEEQEKEGIPWGPANAQALNRYSYVLNNPLRYTDPTGHCPGVWAVLCRAAQAAGPYLARAGRWIGSQAGRFGQWVGGLFRSGAPALPSVAPRALTAADLGIKGSVRLQGTFSVANGTATVRIDMIEGKINNPLQILRSLSETARAAGASKLRIEAYLANPQLNDILIRRYGMQPGAGPDGMDIVEITLK